jgi:hypothetical protein
MESTWMFWFVLLVFGSGGGSGDCGDVEVDEDGYVSVPDVGAKLGHVVVVTVVVVVVVVAVVVVVFLVILILILIMIVVVL